MTRKNLNSSQSRLRGYINIADLINRPFVRAKKLPKPVGIEHLLKSRFHKTVVGVLVCAVGMATVPAKAPPEELSVKVTMVTGERGRDSNSTSTTPPKTP